MTNGSKFGEIRYGKIIGHLRRDELHLVYQCLTKENQLRSGRGVGKVRLDEEGKIRMGVSWEWLDEEKGSGTSEYREK